MENKKANDNTKMPEVNPSKGGASEANVPAGEMDYDELVHASDEEDVENVAKQDPDEAVHQVKNETPSPENEMDVDDLLHSPVAPEEDI